MDSTSHSRTMRCSIVIPTKNGGPLFVHVLEQLKGQRLWHAVELIVVDSGSTDGTQEAARRVGAKVVEIPPADFNHGATRDYGISLASCEIVVLMVQDAVPNDQHLLDALLMPFDDPKVAGVYARQIPQPDADPLTRRKLDNWLTARPEREVKSVVSPAWYESLPPIEKYFFCNFDNVCSAIRKAAWQEHRFGNVGFGEDIDWAERVLKAGFSIVYEPNAAVVHSHDRPIAYEYKRTYVCHRKLYRQFGLQLVPSMRGIFGSWLSSTGQDFFFVASQHEPLSTKFKLWIKSPVLNLLGAFAQYRAAKDEAAGRVRAVAGV